MWIKLPVFITLWAGMILIKAVTFVLGLFVTPYLYTFRKVNFHLFLDTHPWVKPWLNPEDWKGTVHHYKDSLPRWWVDKHGIDFFSFYHYHALRNPGNGLRNFEWLDLDIVPNRVKFRTNYLMDRYEPNDIRAHDLTTVWYFAWQGFHAGCKIVHIWNDKRHLVIKFGWRVEPADSTDRKIAQVLLDDASFASKVLIYREG